MNRLEEQALVIIDLIERIDDMEKKFNRLVKNHNELVEAVNDNTEFRADLIEDMQRAEEELEILFTPESDILRDKSKDH